jgi:tetratricopeptide (TPR) repeat protein
MMTGQYPAALDALMNGLEANPNSIQLRLAGYEVWKHNNNMQRARELLVEIQRLVEYRRWRYRDAWNEVAQGRHQLLQGGDARQVLDNYYLPASLKAPDQAVAFLAMGDLALTKHDYALAVENYRAASELQPDNPAAFTGLARAWRPSDFEKSSQAINRALQLNPRYLPGLHYLVNDRLDSERYDEALEFIERILAVNPRDVRAWTCRAVVAHLQNDPDAEAAARQKAFAVWEGNPEVDYLIGKKLSQRYRFAEGARMQRRALTYDPAFLPAKIQLASDLLRLGNGEEGWRLAEEVYQQDGYNVVAYNLVTLGNTVGGYTVLHQDGFIVRMEPSEAGTYGQLVLDLLGEAKQQLSEKYDVQVAEPVFVEIFPRQQDFAIRTFGLPGGAGFLGVCFGRVITMNSPKTQVRSNSNWQSVLWHEFCHVVTLQKTANRMPRWLSEGISVYEERQRDPSWGQVMTTAWRDRVLNDQMTPVGQLSSAFVTPESPEDLQFAYYQSSLVVEFLIEKHGLATLQKILDDLRVGMPVNEALARYTGDVRLLDEEFTVYARQVAARLAADANWDVPPLTSRSTLEEWRQWNRQHPGNLRGLKAEAALLIAAGELAEAESQLQELARLHPGDRSADNAWTMLAAIARQRGDEATEYEMLKKSSRQQSSATDIYPRLVELAARREDWQELSHQAGRWLANNPLIPAPHRALAEAAENLGEFRLAAVALQALTQMDPVDPAETWFRCAQALQASGQTDRARRAVLKCLEEAPRYRAAHEFLLQLVSADTADGADGADGVDGADESAAAVGGGDQDNPRDEATTTPRKRNSP